MAIFMGRESNSSTFHGLSSFCTTYFPNTFHQGFHNVTDILWQHTIAAESPDHFSVT